MNVLFFLIIVASLLAITFLILFIWANKSNQYEDLETPAIRILTEDD